MSSVAVPTSVFNLPTIETERLILRKLQPEDAADLLAYASDPEVAKYVTWGPYLSVHDAYRFIFWAIDRYNRQQEAPWAVFHKKDARVIGTMGLSEWSPRHNRAEVSYSIGAKYWGQGITPEALDKIFEFAFTKLGINRLEAFCIPENVASARVMEKAGLKFEGLLRQRLYAKGIYHDVQMYSLLKSDWQQK